MAKGTGVRAAIRLCAGAAMALLLGCSSEAGKLKKPVVVRGVGIKEQQLSVRDHSFSKEKPALNYLMTSLSSFFINDAESQPSLAAKQLHQASPSAGRLAMEFWRACLRMRLFREAGPKTGKPNFVLVSVFSQAADPADAEIRKQIGSNIAVEQPLDCYWTLMLFRSGGADKIDLSRHIVPGTPVDKLLGIQGKPGRVDQDKSHGCLIYYYADSRVVVNAKTNRVASWSDLSSNLKVPCWIETVHLTINP